MPKKGLAPQIRKLAINNPELTHSEIARTVGCRPSNVTAVLKTFLGSKTEKDLQDFQENRANVYDSLSMRFLESITARKIAKTSAAQLTTMASILHDKSALLRGQPTGINVNVALDIIAAIRARDESLG